MAETILKNGDDMLKVIEKDLGYLDSVFRYMGSKHTDHEEKVWQQTVYCMDNFEIQSERILHRHLFALRCKLSSWLERAFSALPEDPQDVMHVIRLTQITLQHMHNCLHVQEHTHAGKAPDVSYFTAKAIDENYIGTTQGSRSTHIAGIEEAVYGDEAIDPKQLMTMIKNGYRGRVIMKEDTGYIVGYYLTLDRNQRKTITHMGIRPPYQCSGGQEALLTEILDETTNEIRRPVFFTLNETRCARKQFGM